jgi:hypothetical protein
VAVPSEMPVITPVTGLIKAFPLLLDHSPPGVALAKVVVEPAQILVKPEMEAIAGEGYTVTVVDDTPAQVPLYKE